MFIICLAVLISPMKVWAEEEDIKQLTFQIVVLEDGGVYVEQHYVVDEALDGTNIFIELLDLEKYEFIEAYHVDVTQPVQDFHYNNPDNEITTIHHDEERLDTYATIHHPQENKLVFRYLFQDGVTRYEDVAELTYHPFRHLDYDVQQIDIHLHTENGEPFQVYPHFFHDFDQNVMENYAYFSTRHHPGTLGFDIRVIPSLEAVPRIEKIEKGNRMPQIEQEEEKFEQRQQWITRMVPIVDNLQLTIFFICLFVILFQLLSRGIRTFRSRMLVSEYPWGLTALQFAAIHHEKRSQQSLIKSYLVSLVQRDLATAKHLPERQSVTVNVPHVEALSQPEQHLIRKTFTQEPDLTYSHTENFVFDNRRGQHRTHAHLQDSETVREIQKITFDHSRRFVRSSMLFKLLMVIYPLYLSLIGFLFFIEMPPWYGYMMLIVYGLGMGYMMLRSLRPKGLLFFGYIGSDLLFAIFAPYYAFQNSIGIFLGLLVLVTPFTYLTTKGQQIRKHHIHQEVASMPEKDLEEAFDTLFATEHPAHTSAVFDDLNGDSAFLNWHQQHLDRDGVVSEAEGHSLQK